MIVEIFILAATILVLLWLYYELPIRSIKKQLEPIPGPPALPIVGNLLSLAFEKKGVLEFLKKSTKKYGPVWKFQIPGRVAVFLTNPEDAELLLKNNQILDRSQLLNDFLEPWLGKGLVTSTGKQWKEQRKLITPAFHFNILEKFFEVFKEHTNVLVQILKNKENQNVDIYEMLQLFALDVICETAMGTKIQAQVKLEGNDYVKAVKQQLKCIADRTTNLLLMIPFVYPFTPTGRKAKESLEILKSTTNKVIQTRREQLVKENKNISNGQADGNANGHAQSDVGEKKRVAFLDVLLQARHTDGRPLSNKEIADEVETFMFAGHDTTSTQMSFLFYLLAKEPEIQKQLYKEQCEILGDEKCSPTFHDMQNMEYLERVIKEGQRLLGSVVQYGRDLNQDLKLKTNGYVIPKGTEVDILAYELHRNPRVYSNPEKFDPDRFLPENVREQNVFSFIPFGAGFRNCIGKRFAMLEMKTCVSSVVRNFKILPGVDSQGKLIEPQIESVLLLTSINGIPVRMIPRQ